MATRKPIVNDAGTLSELAHGDGLDATIVIYDNTESGLVASNAQSAIDELQDKKLNIADLAANVVFYPTSASSDIATYFKLVISTDDADYDNPAVDISTGTITTTDQFIAALASEAGILQGSTGVISVSTVGNVRRVSGFGQADFYFEIYKRTSGGTETLMGTSNSTREVSENTYEQFFAECLINSTTFTETDRIVFKYYGNDTGALGNSEFEFQFGGGAPVRSNLPVPVNVVSHANDAEDILVDTSNFDKILSGTDDDVQAALETLDDHTHSFSELSDVDVDLTTQVTGTLPVANGGTGATTATNARTNLEISATNTPYDNTSSGLTATDVQDAIDELEDEKLSLTGGTMTGHLTATVIYADYVYASNLPAVGSFTWDSGTSSPAASVSVGSPVVTRVHAGMRRCILNDSGVVQYYLNQNDSTEKEDGTAANLDGTDGQVMVEIPKFYTRREVSGTQITWSISAIPLAGYTLHPAFTKDGTEVDFRYISAYDACVYDNTASAYISGLNYDNNDGGNGVGVDVTASTGDLLASVSGIYPMVGLTRAEFRTIAANRGSGWRSMDFTLWSAIQMLYLIEYQSFYSQNILGAGNTNGNYSIGSSGNQSDSPHTIAGASNALGNVSTDGSQPSAGAKPGTAYMSYRGIENFYGNVWTWADGILVNDVATGNVYVGNDTSDWSDSNGTGMDLVATGFSTASGYIAALQAIDNYFLSSSNSGGSSSTYTTDYHYASASGDRVVRVGGYAADGATVGVFCVASTYAASNAHRRDGGRLAF